MADPIPPALTPEQWRMVRHPPGMTGMAAIIAIQNAALPPDDPRKITREWVTILRECEDAANSVYPLQLTDEQARTLSQIARALESLLPPE